MSLAHLTQLVPAPDRTPRVEQGKTLDASLRAMLDQLRRTARLKAANRRVDLFEACAMIDHCTSQVAAASAEALMRTLPQTLGRCPRIFRPGTAELSFDEAWLTAALQAARSDDTASLQFLVNRRIRPDARRATTFLLNNLAQHLDTV